MKVHLIAVGPGIEEIEIQQRNFAYIMEIILEAMMIRQYNIRRSYTLLQENKQEDIQLDFFMTFGYCHHSSPIKIQIEENKIICLIKNRTVGRGLQTAECNRNTWQTTTK